MALQAADDRVQLLRRPPSNFSAKFTVFMDNLVILESGGLKRAHIDQDISKHLTRFLLSSDNNARWSCNQCRSVSYTLVLSSNPVGLDLPICKAMSGNTMYGLERMLELAKSLL